MASHPDNSYSKLRNNDFVFSIVIPSWNNLPYLKLCIESIRKNSTFIHQLIVCVNDGRDGTLEWVRQQSDVEFIHNPTNMGVCYALNGCRSLIRTSYVLFINDDMYVCPQWDQYLKEEIEKVGHTYFFFSSTAIEPMFSSNCAIQKDYGSSYDTFDEGRLLSEFKSLPMEDWQGATWPPNVVHISIWDLVGGYSTEFTPGMYSDPDFAMKLWSANVRLFKGVSKSRVYHFGSKSVKRVIKNPGYYRFIAKWGMTSGTFTNHYLKRGKPFSGLLVDPPIGLAIKLKSIVKGIITIFKRT